MPTEETNKPTEENCAFFKERVLFWQNHLKLDDWEVTVQGTTKDEVLGQARIDLGGKSAVIFIGSDWGERKVTEEELDLTALHEVLHVFLAPLTLPMYEYFTSKILDPAEHGLINKLTSLLRQREGSKHFLLPS